MTFQPAKCPTCAGELQVPDDRDVVKCMYCGGDVIVRQAIQAASVVNLANLMKLANAAANANNYQEAYAYYTRALEADTDNVEAWFGKSQAAGWLSTLRDFRLPEMLSGFENAMALAKEDQRAEVKRRAVDAINTIVVACYNLARKHLNEFVALQNTWPEYVNQCMFMLAALEKAHEYDESSRITVENIIFICKDNVEGVKYNDPYDNNFTKILHLSDDYEARVRSLIDDYAKKMQRIDPTYQKPEPQRPSGNCFIAAATLGNENHPTVLLLRAFRDELLFRHRLGRLLVRVYCKYGSWPAHLIGKHDG